MLLLVGELLQDMLLSSGTLLLIGRSSCTIIALALTNTPTAITAPAQMVMHAAAVMVMAGIASDIIRVGVIFRGIY